MSIIKNLISLSTYLTKNSLIKESKYLISLIKEAGYDWKEMGKAPHIKKDEYPESRMENTKIIQPETTTQEIANPDSESDSWDWGMEVPNRGMDEDYNISDDKNIEIVDKNTDEIFSHERETEIIDPMALEQIREKFFGRYNDDESFNSYETLLSVLSDDKHDFKNYIKHIAKDNPIRFLGVLDTPKEQWIIKFKNKFAKEINIAKKCIIDLTEEAKKELLDLVDNYKLQSLIGGLKEYKDLIIDNEKLLLFLINQGESARSQVFHMMSRTNKDNKELIRTIIRIDKEEKKKELFKELDEALLKKPEDFINESFLSGQLESLIVDEKIDQKEVDRYKERAREIIKNR